MAEGEDSGGAWFWGVVVAILLAEGLYYAFTHDPASDSAGWVSHSVQSTITAQSTWLVGERKDCTSYPLDIETAQAQGKQAGYAFSSVQCDNGPEHKITITFQGAENQPTKKTAYWSCTRGTDSFTCKQTGAD